MSSPIVVALSAFHPIKSKHVNWESGSDRSQVEIEVGILLPAIRWQGWIRTRIFVNELPHGKAMRSPAVIAVMRFHYSEPPTAPPALRHPIACRPSPSASSP